MTISGLDKRRVCISMANQEASQLLGGLELLRDELGPIADELIGLLRRGGITPPSNPGHIRTEFAGPEK